MAAERAARGARRVALIGVGNAARQDDAAGIEVVRQLQARAQAAGIATHELEGETLALLDLWQDADAAVLVDAMHGAGPAGSARRIDASSAPVPAYALGSASTHAFGVAEAIELGRALGRLPATVVLFAVAGERFAAGSGLSAQVQARIGEVADAVLREARGLR